MTISYANGGVCIDHGDADLSTSFEQDGSINIDIGEDFTGRHRLDKPQDYARYLSFRLTNEEAHALRDWLSSILPEAA